MKIVVAEMADGHYLFCDDESPRHFNSQADAIAAAQEKADDCEISRFASPQECLVWQGNC